jgi:hypothetical protein
MICKRSKNVNVIIGEQVLISMSTLQIFLSETIQKIVAEKFDIYSNLCDQIWYLFEIIHVR